MDSLDLTKVPISTIRPKVIQVLSNRLNSRKILLNADGLPRDWRGVLCCINIPDISVANFIDSKSPFLDIFDLWIQQKCETATIAELECILKRIDRWDVIDDCHNLFLEDAKTYMQTIQSRQQLDQQWQHNENGYRYVNRISDTSPMERNKLSETNTSQQGLPPHQYDAFLLYADEDIHFVKEILNEMEAFNVKMFVAERDLLADEQENIFRLITHRCKRLIVIISPDFLKNRACTFFVNYANATGLQMGHNRRKIIPIVYKESELMYEKLPIITYISCLNYQHTIKHFNFRDKLCEALQVDASVSKTMADEMGSVRYRFRSPKTDAKSAAHAHRTIQNQPIGMQQPTDEFKFINSHQLKAKPSWFQLPKFCTKTVQSTLCLPVAVNATDNKENKYAWYRNHDKSTQMASKTDRNELLPLIAKTEADFRLI